MNSPLKAKIFEVVNRIPSGKVAFYGQIAQVCMMENQPVRAQVVGWILSGMKISEFGETCWHRVVAKNGFVVSLKLGNKGLLQIALLESENVEIVSDFIDMSKFSLDLKALN